MKPLLAAHPWRSPVQQAKRDATLSHAQVVNLGILLALAQLPLTPNVPVWVAISGVAFIALRFVLVHRARRRNAVTTTHVPAWLLALVAVALAFLIRHTYGYFVGRDPCVAFLFVLVGIKFLEVRTLRDGTLLVCLAIFLLVTPFFYSQSIASALFALPAIGAVGAALDALADGDARSTFSSIRRAWRRTFVMVAQGLPIAGALFVLFPRLASPLWGLPADRTAASGLSDSMSPGSISELSLSDAVAFRVDFDGAPPPPRMRYWRGPVLSIFNGREWRALSPRPGGRLLRGEAPSVRYTVTLE
ncbi:MAG TPA: DUF3488 domain-containing protein, partial [Casimicrobiaceae bacterium]